jgi:hypothetical protein
VHAALAAAKHAHCNLVVFPGWTLVGESLPHSILRDMEGMTVVCELIPIRNPAEKTSADGGVPKTMYVVQNGQVILKAVQRVARSGDLYENADTLVADLRARRRFGVRGLDVLLLICGEVNLLKGSNQFGRFRPFAGCMQDLAADVIVNPAHTPTNLPAMVDKRAHLAKQLLVTTANTFEGLQGAKPSARWKGAGAWCKGGAVQLHVEHDAQRKDGWRLLLVDVPVPRS